VTGQRARQAPGLPSGLARPARQALAAADRAAILSQQDRQASCPAIDVEHTVRAQFPVMLR
jgi:hypothetical protein